MRDLQKPCDIFPSELTAIVPALVLDYFEFFLHGTLIIFSSFVEISLCGRVFVFFLLKFCPLVWTSEILDCWSSVKKKPAPRAVLGDIMSHFIFNKIPTPIDLELLCTHSQSDVAWCSMMMCTSLQYLQVIVTNNIIDICEVWFVIGGKCCQKCKIVTSCHPVHSNSFP